MNNQGNSTRTFSFRRQTSDPEFRSQRFETMPRNFRASVSGNSGEGIPPRLPQSKRISFSDFLQRQNMSNGNRQNMPYPQQTDPNTNQVGKGDNNDGYRKDHRSHFGPKGRGFKRQLESNGNDPQLSRDIDDSSIRSGNNTDDITLPNLKPRQSN